MPSALIYPNTNRQDMAFDATRNQLFITTTAGTIERYDAIAKVMLSSFSVPGSPSLNGLDITPDGSTLVVGDNVPGATQGFIHRIDATSGANTTLSYNFQSLESGSYDVVVLGNTSAFVSTRFAGSGWTPLRTVDLVTNTVGARADLPGGVRQDSSLSRAADRSRVMLGEANSSGGPIRIYSAATDSFAPSFSTNIFLGSVQTAVNRDGSLIAMEVGSNVSIFKADYTPVENLASLDGGIVFDPVRDRLYAINSTTDQLVAFDTSTWQELFREPVGENVAASNLFGAGAMTIDSTGTAVYLGTPAGVRRIDLPTSNGVATKLTLTEFPSYLPSGTAGTFTVTATDASGAIATGFTGTVSFTSSSGTTTLPSNYTFTAADAGRKSFSATFNATGTQSLTANSAGLAAGTQGNITVHATNPVTRIPVTDYRGMVFDDTRGLLYLTTPRGVIERYHPATRTLLAPLATGGSLLGLDITADGGTLYAADSLTGATGGFIRKVNLATGAVTPLGFVRASGEAGAFDLVAFGNGKAFFTTEYSGSGWTPMRSIDLTTDSMSVALSSVRQRTLFSRAADRSRGIFTESNSSGGPWRLYDAAANTFSASYSADTSLTSTQSGVNRDGTLAAAEFGSAVSIFNADLLPKESLPNMTGGFVFDPIRDRMYSVNATNDELVAFDTSTWRELYRLAIGEDAGTSTPFGVGEIAINGAGTQVFLGTTLGVRVITLPADTMVASKLTLSGFPVYIPGSSAATFTVTALDPAGNVATGFTGTVTITSSAGSASLPGAYTFTAADAGRKTFTAAIHTIGTHSLTANSSGLTAGSQTGIVVHNTATVSLIPVSDYRGMVYDTARDLLYIATPRGVIERYSPTTRTLLEPWTVGGSLLGIDMAPDGSTVYAADSISGFTGGFVRTVQPDTGTISRASYLRASGELGVHDIAVFGNGIALFSTQFSGSGWTPLHTLNLATNTVGTALSSVRQNSLLARGADRSLGFLTESNISSGPVRAYYPATGTFSNSVNTNTFLDSRPAAVNRNGTLIALELNGVSILNNTLGSVITLSGPDAGMVFDPLLDRLYAARSSTGAISVYDTNSWAVVNTIPTGQTIPSGTSFSSEQMAISDDGRWLFLDVTGGVHVRRLVLNTSATLDVSPPGPITFGQSVTFTASIAGGKPSERAGQMVTFKNGTTTLGSAPLNAAGAATLNLTPTAGTYTITAVYAGDANYNPSTSFAVPLVVTPPVGIGSVVIGDGSTFSVVRSITVAFSGLVTVNAGAFTVEKLDGAGGFAVINVATQTVNSKTVATLSFSGSLTEFASLVDGRYRLTINGAALLDSNGATVDADGNGQAGGTHTQNFHRLFGDADGNFTVDAGDFATFGSFFGQTSPGLMFDFNNDGTVDGLDMGQFGNQFGVTL